MIKVLIITISFFCSMSTLAGSHNSLIKQLQGEGLEDPYNSIHLIKDVTDSPCTSTNESDRFAISNNVHQSLALAALIAGKKVYIGSTGQCNAANIETINFLTIKAQD